ncbi:MAG: response regulator transcription factor [Woeseiaceae bacterium]|nr:response regulator transcription factor [Woeseiaceae bacterium]
MLQTLEKQPDAVHRILVVEDNPHTAYLLQFIMQRSGYEVIIAADGRDALAAIENLEPVDAAIIDLMLPYVSGYQLIQTIRENVDWHNVPIIVLSGKVLEQDIVKAFDYGADDYVTKPFRPRELLARLKRCLTRNLLEATST